MKKEYIPIMFVEVDKQKWFESLKKINKLSIPSNLVSMTEMKSLGIEVEEKEAVGWAYQQFTHKPYLLYDKNM